MSDYVTNAEAAADALADLIKTAEILSNDQIVNTLTQALLSVDQAVSAIGVEEHYTTKLGRVTFLDAAQVSLQGIANQLTGTIAGVTGASSEDIVASAESARARLDSVVVTASRSFARLGRNSA